MNLGDTLEFKGPTQGVHHLTEAPAESDEGK
jgi:hypothetical protein